MRHLTILFSIITLILSTSSIGINYKKYCNDRFQFCIEYPENFTSQSLPQNGDGQSFLSPDKKAEITAYGSLVGDDVDRNLQENFEMATDNVKVTSKTFNNNWYIFSGIDSEGKIIYRKTVLRRLKNYGVSGSATVFQTLMITFPPSQKNKYSFYYDKILNSL